MEHVAKVEAELQKICEGILALMDRNFIPSARRIAGAEGHQQRTLKRSSSFEQVDFEQVAERERQHRKPRDDTNRAKQSGASKNTQHNVKVVAVKNQQKFVKKPRETSCREKDQGSDVEGLTWRTHLR